MDFIFVSTSEVLNIDPPLTRPTNDNEIIFDTSVRDLY